MKRILRIIVLTCLLFFSYNVYAISVTTSPNSITISGAVGEQIDDQIIKEVLIQNISFNNENGDIVYRYNANNQNNTVKIVNSTIELYNTSGYLIEKDQKSEVITNGNKSYYYTFTNKEGIEVASYKLIIDVSLYNENYYIENYDVSMNVYENNVYEIVESIDVFFLIPQHGILRNIPLDNSVEREDGSVSNNRAKVSEIRVNDKYKVSYNGSYETIRIGDANKTIRGEKHYEIKYYYSIGKDPLGYIDEFYFNVIGHDWDAAILNASFNINMPKEFDSYLVGVTSGLYGAKDTGRAKYSTDGNVITGKTTGTLLKNEGLTVRLELEDGYFNNRFNYALFKKLYGDKFYLLTPLLFLIIVPFIYRRHGKNDIVDSIEVSPPDGKNSLEVAYIYRTYAREKDIISLLVYLANKKYLKIEETESRNGIKGFRLTKLKDYDGGNPIEEKFMDGLFKSGTTATKSSLQNSFYRTIGKINEMISQDEYKVIDKKERDNSVYMYGLLIVLTALFMVLPLRFIITEYLKTMVLMFIGVVGLLALIVTQAKDLRSMMSIFLVGLLFFFVLIFNDNNMDRFLSNTPYILYFVICQLILLYIVMFITESKKRTPDAAKALGQIKGFKNFLETVEKERLAKLVEEHPNYFYDILPYAYVLDVSDKWIEKFEDIGFKEPEWYEGTKGFDFDTFDRNVNDTLHHSKPPTPSRGGSSFGSGGSGSSFGGSFGGGGFSSGGGGGSTGGGFSGGGSGGGGGSSW